jgi:hypothetical protein
MQFIKGSDMNRDAVAFATEQMAAKLNHDPRLCEILIPKWEVGCRRITPGPGENPCRTDFRVEFLTIFFVGYLESFTEPNCHVTNSKITHISDNAVHTEDGVVHEVDVGKLIAQNARIV